MSDIFVSYKREDLARVERLVAALRADGFDLWWDHDIPPGAAWEAAITEALDKARCVLVCWSEVSTHPQSGAKVQVEARVANDAGKLIQIKLEATTQPLFFRQWQAADLSGWSGEPSDRNFQSIVLAAREVVSGARLAADRFTAGAATAPMRGPARRRRAVLGAAVAAAAFLGAGWVAAVSTDAPLLICSLTNADKLCLSESELDAFDAALADAKTRLAQRAIFYIQDRRQNFPTVAWAISQLAAPNTEGLKDQRDAYDARLGDLIDAECGCLKNGPAPHTMTNAWMLVTTAAFDEPAPATVIDAMLAGQSAEGWWSSALDAVDEPGNGSTYATAFVILALRRQLDLEGIDAARAGAMRRAVEAGSGWLVHQISTPQGFLSDYPQSVRKLANPGIDGQTLAALAVARPDVNLKARAARLAAALDELPPLWTTDSSDVVVLRRNNAQYYDDFRHISAAWMVLGAVSGLRDLDAFDRARVQAAVRRVFKRDLASSELFEREWIAAEAIFALAESVERLRIMSANGLDDPFRRQAGS